MAARSHLLWMAATLGACATLGQGSGGDENLPNAEAGPFRKIVKEELGNLRSAPNAIDDGRENARDPAIVDRDGDPSTLAIWGYFAATVAPGGEDADPAAPPNAIVRYGAVDGRSFDRDRVLVLEPELAWEGGTGGAPAVLREGSEVWLYYASAGGIGRARSSDGAAFTRDPEPVLAPSPAGWDAGQVPASPAVVRLWDGSLRMFYAVAGQGGASSIGEASSSDGAAFTRVGAGPALAPSAPGFAPDAGDEPYDSLAVGSPYALLATSPQDERILRVYYGATDRLGNTVVGLAARFGTDGPLERAVAPVFGAGESLGPHEPCVVPFEEFSLLFAPQRAGRTAGKAYPAIAAGVAPAKATLPPPEPK